MVKPFAIVIPAKNEENTIAEVIASIKQQEENFDIIVVNDCSDDNTQEVVEDLDVILLNHLESRGAWQATQTGLLHAYERGYKVVISMDADGQHLASQIKLLKKALESDSDADFVVGACVERGNFGKKTVWRVFRLLTGLEVADLTSGFRAYNRSAMAVLTSEQACLLEYQDIGVLLMLKSTGLKCVEVPVEINDRLVGKSRIFSSWIRITYYIISTFILSLAKSAPEEKSKFIKRLK